MLAKESRKYFTTALVLTWAFLCSCDRTTIPHGYRIYKRDTGVTVIIDQTKHRNEVIHPNITKFSVCGEFVVGYAEAVTEIDGFVTPGGYFVFDTKTSSAKEGLSSEEFSNYVTGSLGIAVPELGAAQ